MWNVLAVVVVGVFGILGSLIVFFSACAMFRVEDALSRINVFSPATGLGMPMILVAAYVYELNAGGFKWSHLLMAALAFLALIIVSSVASNTLSRSTVLSGQPIYRKTEPNRLAQAREDLPEIRESAQAAAAEIDPDAAEGPRG